MAENGCFNNKILILLSNAVLIIVAILLNSWERYSTLLSWKVSRNYSIYKNLVA